MKLIIYILCALQAGFAFADQADNGITALKLLKDNSYDLVVTDIQMPHMTGLELLERMRSKNIDTPVIVLTAYGSKEAAIRALRAGAYDFMEKPFNLRVLLRLIKTATDFNMEFSEKRLHLNNLLKEKFNQEMVDEVQSQISALGKLAALRKKLPKSG